jgi:hypothetical protein
MILVKNDGIQPVMVFVKKGMIILVLVNHGDQCAQYHCDQYVENSAFATWLNPEAPDWFVPETSSKVLVS